MKLFFKIVLSIFLVFLIFAGGMLFYITRGLKSGKNVVISDANASALSDGNYIGKYKQGRWTNEVQVSVKNGKIVEVKVLKDVKVPQQEITKKIFDKVIEKQNANVDSISGATVTSKAYLKAIEDALKSNLAKN